MKFQNLLAIAASTALLAACGGGGGGDSGGTAPTVPTTSTPGQAQGPYTGTFAIATVPNGKLNMVILENDEYWALYGLDNGSGGLTVYGFVQGQGVSNNGTFTSSNLKDYSSAGTASGVLNVTYQTGISFSGIAVVNGQSASLAGNTSAASLAAYNTPANLADITGAWSGTTLNNSSFSLTISPTGAVNGSDASGCAATGSINGRNSGKNVFDVTLTAANTVACGTSAGQSSTGIGASSVLSNGQRQLILALINADRSQGTVLFATR